MKRKRKRRKLQSSNANLYFNRGLSKMNMGDYKGAITELDKFIRLEPNNPYAYHNRGIAKDHLQQHEAAIIDFDAAIRLKPDFAIAYSSRGIAKMNLGEGQTEIADYDMAIHLGEAGQYDAAIADFSEIIRLQPDFAAAYHDRGIARSLKDDAQGARKDFQKAVDFAKSTGDMFLVESAAMKLDDLERHNQE